MIQQEINKLKTVWVCKDYLKRAAVSIHPNEYHFSGLACYVELSVMPDPILNRWKSIKSYPVMSYNDAVLICEKYIKGTLEFAPDKLDFFNLGDIVKHKKFYELSNVGYVGAVGRVEYNTEGVVGVKWDNSDTCCVERIPWLELVNKGGEHNG